MTRSTVLVVEDDPGCSNLLQEILYELGHDVVVSRRAGGFLDLVAQHRPALVILDMMLPDGNGLELLDLLRGISVGAALPVILCTAAVLDKATGQVESSDRHTYILPKPFHVDAFASATTRMLAAS